MTDAAWAERIGNTRLTAKKVAALLRDYIAGSTAKQLAEAYGLSPNSIDTYTGGGAWTHLLGKRGCPSLEDLRAARKLTPNAKITLEMAREIRQRLAAGETGKSLAEAYGLHPVTISNIRHGLIWRDPDLS